MLSKIHGYDIVFRECFCPITMRGERITFDKQMSPAQMQHIEKQKGRTPRSDQVYSFSILCFPNPFLCGLRRVKNKTWLGCSHCRIPLGHHDPVIHHILEIGLRHQIHPARALVMCHLKSIRNLDQHLLPEPSRVETDRESFTMSVREWQPRGTDRLTECPGQW